MNAFKTIAFYLLKFLGAFSLLYYGTKAIIGLSAPGNRYSPFVAHYLDFIDPLRYILLYAAKALLSLFGCQTNFVGQFILKIADGKGVYMAYGCIGYGVISFWLAFVFANKGSWKKKGAWMVGGWLLLCAINVIRIALLLVAINKGWLVPVGWDHHTWFNVVAYLLIFGMIYLYDGHGSQKKSNGVWYSSRRLTMWKKRTVG